jgi:SsrA-binding protein
MVTANKKPQNAKQEQKKQGNSLIVQNKKAFFDFFIEEQMQAGLVLQGWEVKAIRDHKVQLKESYVIIRNGEVFLLGCHISPLLSASTHINPDLIRTKKVLLHNKEILKLKQKVDQAGYTLVPINLHFSKGNIKLTIGVAKGKKNHDKRDTIKDRDWQREKARLMKKDA